MKSVTMDDVAHAVGVSRALVSIAYRGVAGVSEQTRERIFEAGRRLGYRPNAIASRLASKPGGVVGIFLQDLRNDLFADVYDGIRDELDAAGKLIVLSVAKSDGSLDEHALDALLRSRVDVVIAVGLLMPDDAVARVAESVCIVSTARDIPRIDSVVSDNLVGATLATRHLIDLGHTRIAFLANPLTDGYAGRREGYLAAMTDAGLEPLVAETTYERADAARDAGRLLDRGRDVHVASAPVTAIFAHNDQAALGVLDALIARGLAPVSDLSLVGYDNSTAGQVPGVHLTTVDLHGRELGRAAARAALARIQAPGIPRQFVSSTPSLVVRHTTGPVRRR